MHSRKYKECHNVSSSKALFEALYEKDPISAIMATSWGQFQVHPGSQFASQIKSEKIMERFTQSGDLPADLDERLLSDWIARSPRFKRLVREGYKSKNPDWSRIAATYNGSTHHRGHNYYYGILLARQYIRAVEVYNIKVKEKNYT